MAQRMESVAPPGGVMLSASTARLVEHAAVLGEPEWVSIKGSDEPVTAHRLLDAAAERELTGRSQPTLVGRDVELLTITGMLDRSVSGHGCVIGVAGPAGIGKSRLVGETVALAKSRGVEVFSAFCESHTRERVFENSRWAGVCLAENRRSRLLVCVRDYETRPDHHEAMVHLAMITTMTRRLART